MFVFVVNRNGKIVRHNHLAKETLVSLDAYLWDLFSPSLEVKRVFENEVKEPSGRRHRVWCRDKSGKKLEVLWESKFYCETPKDSYYYIVAWIMTENILIYDLLAVDHDCNDCIECFRQDTEHLLRDRVRNALCVIDTIIQVERTNLSEKRVAAIGMAIAEILEASEQCVERLDKLFRVKHG